MTKKYHRHVPRIKVSLSMYAMPPPQTQIADVRLEYRCHKCRRKIVEIIPAASGSELSKILGMET